MEGTEVTLHRPNDSKEMKTIPVSYTHLDVYKRQALSIDSKVLVILEEGNEFAALSARNLPNVKVATATTASVLDLSLIHI